MMYRIFNGLKRLKRYAVKEKVRIVNMSDDSWVDCFPRYVKEKNIDVDCAGGEERVWTERPGEN